MSNPSPSLSKCVDDLTVEDFDAFPLWEFATDEECAEGRDETWVRPLQDEHLRRGAMGLLVAADFTAANGKEMEGFVNANLLRGFIVHEGSILYAGKSLGVSSMLGASELEYVAERVGLCGAELFPLEWVVRVQVHGETEFRKGSFLQ
jgi:hypothetical protein